MNRRDIKISPSLLAADFTNLEREVRKCEEGGADILHLDIMDGHFVPNITFGPAIVKAIRKLTDMPFSCHLMISEPDKYIEEFAEAGADYISVHVEGALHLHRTLSLIKSLDIKTGVALNPATPLDYAYHAAEFCDFILLMSVNPGFGGQKFIPSFLRRAENLKNFLIKSKLDDVLIEVDGGVKIENATSIARAGADILVAGSAVFNGNVKENISQIRENATKGLKYSF